MDESKPILTTHTVVRRIPTNSITIKAMEVVKFMHEEQIPFDAGIFIDYPSDNYKFVKISATWTS